MVRPLSVALLAQAAAASVSNIHIPQIATTIAINLPPNSQDINFYMTAPAYYQYVALGFGSSMTNSFMLVAYPAADGRHVTVSPRVSTGDWEPQYYSNYRIYLNGNSSVNGQYLVASGTCLGCRAWPGGFLNSQTNEQPMMYAVGPGNTPINSNDAGVTIHRHSNYGRFVLSTIQATGYGGTGALTSVNNGLNTGASQINTYGANSAGGVVEGDFDGLGLGHGATMAVAALVLAPIDLILGSGRLLTGFPLIHAVVSLVYLCLVVAGFGMGIRISGEYVATQHFDTAHQAIGFAVFFLGLMLLGLGIVLHVGRALSAAGERGPVALIHMWGTRLLWILVLINGGLGLQLAESPIGLVIGYCVLAGAAFLAVVFVLACLTLLGSRRARSRGGPPPTGQYGTHHHNHPHHNNARKSVGSGGSRKTSSGDSEPVVLPEDRHGGGRLPLRSDKQVVLG